MVRTMVEWASRSFRGAPFTSGPGSRLDGLGSGDRVTPLFLMILACALLLGRASIAGSLAEPQGTPSLDHADRATTPVPVVSNTLLGLVRLEGRCTLRSGRCRHVVFVTDGWDNPNDDETSDDPADDDAWEGLNAVGETEVPVSAWFQEVGCYHSDLDTQSEPLWYEPFLFTSFLTLQRLRC
ncbi:MAG: hypothetical protein JO344_01700 [Planctomycetaceae bacterium]|nr:hypothetical protein [Planctomycetaceae bacterium]